MKTLLYLVITGFAILACTKDSLDAGSPESELGFSVAEASSMASQACGKTPIIWLEDILEKAEDDKASMKHLGNYIGWISLTTFKGKPHFVVNMGMGSGGLAFRLFDCGGNWILPQKDETFPNFVSDPKARGKVIYSSLRK